MITQSRRIFIVIILSLLSFIPVGCIFDANMNFYFSQAFEIKSGIEQNVLVMKFPFSVFVPGDGNAIFSGKLTPLAQGGSIPFKLTIFIRHLDTKGKMLEMRKYVVKMQLDGAINKQTFPFKQLTIGANEQIRFSVRPTGNISPSTLQFKLQHVL